MVSADRLRSPSIDGPDGTGVAVLLRGTGGTLRDAPEVFVVFLFAAPLGAVLDGAGGLVTGLASILAEVVLLEVQYVNTSGSNSMGTRLFLAFVSTLVTSFAILMGLLLVLPGLYAIVRFYLVIPAVLIDDHGPIEPLRTSWQRTEGRVLEGGGVVFRIYLATFVVAAVVLLGTAGGVELAIEGLRDGQTFFAETARSPVNGPPFAASSTLIYQQTRE